MRRLNPIGSSPLQDWLTLTAQPQDMETQAKAQKIRRPAVDEVCRLWVRIVELYEAGTDEEREAILQAMVGRVEMDEKETGTCDLAFLPQVPDSVLELTNHLGAGRMLVKNYPLLHVRDFAVPPRSRKTWDPGDSATKQSMKG